MSAVTETAVEKRQEQASTAVTDCLFLAGAVVLSLILYAGQLGFYSDDWVFLSLLRMSPDQSLPGLFKALYYGDLVIQQRPVQVLYLGLLYRFFGLNPTGYHAVNGAVLVANTLLFYAVLRELRLPRVFITSVPLVYSLLPHYSTDRFWVAAFQATISMAFYFLSLWADLRAVNGFPGRFAWWKLLGALSLLLSGMAYEAALPLFLLNPLIVWYAAVRKLGKTAGSAWTRKMAVPLFAWNLAALLLVIGYKALVSVRIESPSDLITHLIALIVGAVRVNFGTYGIGLPYVVWWILRHAISWPVLVGTILVGAGIFLFLYRISSKLDFAPSRKKSWLAAIAVGLVFFAAGYAIFIINTDVWFTSTSLGNRVAVAAAVGFAITAAAGAGWVSAFLPSPEARRRAFCFSITLLCASGFLITNTLAAFWGTAYQRQQSIFADIQAHTPALPASSTLILDGVCLEHGGAYLFTGQRDLASLLAMTYNDPTLNASAVTNRPRIEPDGLYLMTYRVWDYFPYGEDLLVFHYPQKKVYTLMNETAAWEYFENSGFDPQHDCPPGFAWGLNTP